MQLSQESLAEYKALFKKHYGQDLTDTEALESATRLLNFCETVLKMAHEARLKGKWPKELEKNTA